MNRRTRNNTNTKPISQTINICGCCEQLGLQLFLIGLTMFLVCEDAGKIIIDDVGNESVIPHCDANPKVAEVGWIYLWIGVGIILVQYLVVFILFVYVSCYKK